MKNSKLTKIILVAIVALIALVMVKNTVFAATELPTNSLLPTNTATNNATENNTATNNTASNTSLNSLNINSSVNNTVNNTSASCSFSSSISNFCSICIQKNARLQKYLSKKIIIKKIKEFEKIPLFFALNCI